MIIRHPKIGTIITCSDDLASDFLRNGYVEVRAVEPDSSGDAVKAPPKSGRGASEKAWRDYAESLHIDVSTAESRDDVIDLIEAASA